jgi:Transglutaminase-like enzymes, putative cysteine proteases
MKTCLLLIAAAFISVALPAQIASYDLASVPEVVKKNADVIKRYGNMVFEVSDIDKATLNVHEIVTVQNEKGRDALAFYQYSSKTLLLDDVELKVYDASGKLLNKYRKKDMYTRATGEGLVEDGFVTHYSVSAGSYPITVETKYQVKFKGLLAYPAWFISRPGTGVENSSFTVKVPKDLDLRYKEKNIQLPPQVAEEGAYKIYKWQVSNLPPVADEEGAVKYRSRYPSIQIAPNRFSYYNRPGSLDSWNSFGQWMAALYKGQDELPAERQAFFQEMVKDAPSDREKVKRIYQYLQKNFRYVSIQLGIGGFKPFSADFTDKKKYGDCKGLSNYMKAALKAVGINSHVAIINSDYNSEPVEPDFPIDVFDHVILCVPQPKDSIWLECTSNTADFGVLGSFTENRRALLVTDNGGVLVPTPSSKAANNTQHATTTVQLEEDGSGLINTTFRTTGRYREIMDYVVNEKKEDQKEFIVFGIGFKQPDDFEFAKQESGSVYTSGLKMAMEKVPEFTAGNKMFLAPRLYKIWGSKLPKAENRKLDYYFRNPFIEVDTTIFKLPEGVTPDALPKEKSLQCAFASYNTKYWFNEAEKAVYSTATLELRQHKIPAAQYAEVKQFFDEVLMDDGQRIVVVKK